MKYIWIALLLFSTMLQAEYLRTIRIASFQTEVESVKALEELNKFIATQENVINLQKEWDFEFKARRSGKYYITLVEPFTERKILQEVLNTLRKGYADIYVTRITRQQVAKIEVIPAVLPTEEVPPEILSESLETEKIEIAQSSVNEVTELKINQDEVKQDEVKEEQVETTIKTPPFQELEAPQKVTQLEENYTIYYWQIASLILFLLIIYLIQKVLRYKKDNEVYFNSDIIKTEKFNQLNAEMKDREKYLSHASHELRAPMTAIMGLAHLVLDSDLEKQEREYIKQIESSATNLLSIVNDILDVSKIKAGELHIEKVEFNVNNILEYVLNIISLQAKHNNINCVIDMDKDVPSHIVGDSLRLGQVLINLLGNAVKFTKDGEVSLHVKKVSNFRDVITLEFIVSDDGMGMSPEQLENIFQSFTQADNSTSRKFGGTGLGLSISQELVRMMHGEIKVKSTLGSGTTFSFEIPFKIKDHLNKRQYRLPSAKLMNKRILVIDSSEKNVMQLIQMLGYFKYKTHTIPSFEESVIEEGMEFDIVIINKNHLSNLTINKLLRMQKEKHFKIVVLSELFSTLNNKILKNLVVDTYLQVPFNQQNILNMIIELHATKKINHKEKTKKAKDILNDVEGKKVLIAEDNEVNHKVISGLLAKTGIDITYAINGKEAVDYLLAGREFDLILMDISMPIMNGLEATREIRKHKEYDDIPILALTADVMEDSISKAMAAGMQGHISKPIIIDIFYKKIYHALHTPNKEVKPTLSNIKSTRTDEPYEEISISIGLERYNDDKAFFHSILKDFKKMYINSPLELEGLCREEKYKEARFKAMDIKDVALSIGAYNLCESAAAMEYNLEKGSRSNWAELIASYEIELDKLFKDIDKYLKTNYS